MSQLTKALTGIEYASRPHHYKPKSKSAKKRTTEEGKPSNDVPQKQHKVAQKAKPKTDEHTTTFELRNIEGPDKATLDDTLESESSSSDLPPGL